MKQALIKLSIFLFFVLHFSISSALGIQTLIKNRITGHFDPVEDPSFVLILSEEYPIKPMYVHRVVFDAYLQMREAAQRDSIEIPIVSATRNYDRQKEIWEYKWKTFRGTPYEKITKILEFSSMPGTSRHHWGTDIDLCSVEDIDWTTPQLQKTLEWLKENAHKYGFFMPYDDNSKRPGYKYEPWHWSYYPISDFYTEYYRKMITYEDIQGFHGDNLAKELDVINRYVLGIASH